MIAAFPLGLLASKYRTMQEQLGTVNDYAYVAKHMRKTVKPLLPTAPLECRVYDSAHPLNQAACREEMFTSWFLRYAMLVTAPLLAAAALRARRFAIGPTRAWSRVWLPTGMGILGVGLSLTTHQTLPAHLAIAGLLIWPRGKIRPWAVRFPAAGYAWAALLTADVALNPEFEIRGLRFESVHRYLFDVIPRVSGIRSEYRIFALTTLLASVAVAGCWEQMGHLFRRVPKPLQRLAVAGLAAFAVADVQPLWQEFQPIPTLRHGGAVEAASLVRAEETDGASVWPRSA